jgi:hypothetical protein
VTKYFAVYYFTYFLAKPYDNILIW